MDKNADSTFSYWKKALSALSELEMWEEIVDLKLDMGYYFGRIGEPDSMDWYYESAKVDALTHFGKTHTVYARVLDSQSRPLRARGEFKSAIKLMQEAIAIVKNQSQRNIDLLDEYVKRMADYYREMGDLEEAIFQYNKVIESRYALPEDKREGFGIYHAFFSKARALQAKNDHQAAVFNRKEGIRHLESLGSDRPYVPYLFLHMDLAVSYIHLGELDSAALILKKTEQLVRPDHSYGKASIQYTYGFYYLEKGEYEKAEKAILKSKGGIIEYSTSSKEDPDVGRTLNLMGRALGGQGKYKEALLYFLHAAQVASGIPQSKHYWQIPPSESFKASVLVVEILQNFAQTAWKFYQLEQHIDKLTLAYKAYQGAIGLVPRIRRELYAEGSRLFFSEKLAPLLEEAIRTAHQIYSLQGDVTFIEDAYEYAELSRLSLLFENLQASSAKHQSALPEELIAQLEYASAETAYLERRISEFSSQSSADSLQLKNWKNQLYEVREAHKKLIKQIETQYPAYYQLKYDFQLATAATVRSYLQKTGANMLQYFWGADSVYIFSLTPGSIGMNIIPADSQFIQDIFTLKNRLQNPGPDPAKQNLHTEYLAASQRLYEYLIPVSLPPSQQLIIAPDGLLAYIPFELLLTQAVDMDTFADYRSLPYLLRLSAVRYVFSSTIMLTKQIRLQEISRPYTGFAPSYGKGTEPLSYLRGENANAFLPLVYNLDEVKEVHTHWGGLAYYDAEATEEHFKAEAPFSQILHLSQHAFTDDVNPLNSGLVFYQSPHANTQSGAFEKNEGILYVHELYLMTLGSELAVLSACHTGRGKMQHGEGIMSLARAFRYAGCPSIVMSLWETEGAAAKTLVTHFFELLGEGMDKASALRQAKLAYLDQAPPIRTDPYLWGNLVLIGDVEPLQIDQGMAWWIWGVLFAALLAVLLFGTTRISRARGPKSLTAG